jgi:high affinity Mn2+ porin
MKKAIAAAGFFLSCGAAAAPGVPAQEGPQRWNLHGQATTVTQYHGSFHSPYAGGNSLQSGEELRTSYTSTLFLGLRAWKDVELYINPELQGGEGFSGVTGIAGFTNGEITRVSESKPQVSLARLFLRKTWDLGDDRVFIRDYANQLAGNYSGRRLTVTLGKFAATDIYDYNIYSHDPRTQFLNWAAMNSGAWDYPADTRGYSWGASLEYTWDSWTARLGSFMVPTGPNGAYFDQDVASARGDVAEVEHRHQFWGRDGAVHLLFFMNHARMGSYRDSLALSPQNPNLADTRQAGRIKYGWAINGEQAITRDIGLFFRMSWNDGATETWHFTEIDRGLALGVSVGGRRWQRSWDRLGLAFVMNGLSPDHRDFLAAGGQGFVVGDGRLNYGLEKILEGYYSLALFNRLSSVTFDFQQVWNPAYNQDRGPVSIFGLRLHLAL